MSLFSAEDQQRIADAITAAEQRTSGEIVAVVAAESSSYLHAAVLWAALAALVVPLPLIYLTWWPIQWIYGLQLVVFAVLVALLSWRPLRLALVPRQVRQLRAHRRAVEQFLAQNLHTTAGRTGVMIFVSMAERYAEVLADAGIHARVPHAEWQGIVDGLTEQIAKGHGADGFVAAIGAIGGHLANHFPPGSRDPNELPNHLIILSGD
ncbi:MAG: TPM domain-containing protein [Hyphomicrobiaceae bacterium]